MDIFWFLKFFFCIEMSRVPALSSTICKLHLCTMYRSEIAKIRYQLLLHYTKSSSAELQQVLYICHCMILHIIEYLYVGPHANRRAIFDFMQININIIYCSRAQNDIERGLYEHERNTACTHWIRFAYAGWNCYFIHTP